MNVLLDVECEWCTEHRVNKEFIFVELVDLIFERGQEVSRTVGLLTF